MKFDNYSKTPWAECLDQVLDSDGFAILRATENPLDKTQHRANVQRIVACVNACKGISTDNLIENVPLKQGLTGLNQQLRDTKAQRDELVAILERLMKGRPGGVYFIKWEAEIADAIAKAKGVAS
ncbi:hypothetical protein [Klebsiella michiganensis]|uniref:hypothetical protein n=1 Tax=Klebsiella michiganensis TaxID=1134687 RepID=UPI00295E3B93|nr:hypothetical protein [Klebsiella michiganensis]